MVTARRSFQGELPVAAFKRLGEALAGDAGLAHFELDFGTDSFGTACLEVRVTAPLTLICQRTLEPFVLPVVVDAKLGLIRNERDEDSLPPGFEPLLVADDGKLSLLDVIEDELLLALPLVPVNPDSGLPDHVVAPELEETPASGRSDNPFAVLRELKK
jgi:uncharacterized protein